jgi:hypothetical protein
MMTFRLCIIGAILLSAPSLIAQGADSAGQRSVFNFAGYADARYPSSQSDEEWELVLNRRTNSRDKWKVGGLLIGRR